MKKNLVEINIHGNNFDGMKSKFNLAVKSVGEACHAINILTRNKFYSQLLENDKKNIKYEILINKSPCLFDEDNPPDINNPASLLNSELVINHPNLKTIDIIPVIEGAEDVGLIIVGVILIIVGAVLAFPSGGASLQGSMWGFALIMGGLGLVAAGIMNLLSTPPKLDDFKGANRRGSYLFDGPENTIGEGGPVPLVYGELLVGSQTIATTYHITDQDAGEGLSSAGNTAPISNPRVTNY